MTMHPSKVCTGPCGKRKQLAEFGKNKSRDDGKNRMCKDCANAASRGQRAKKTAWMRRIKLDSGCVDWGYDKHPTALQFDHINDDKEFGIARESTYSYARLRAEMDKCEIVCANCHAIRTYERLHGQRD